MAQLQVDLRFEVIFKFRDIKMPTANSGFEQRVSAWSGWQEWEQVYTYLYSDNEDKQRWAIGRIAAWKSRIHPNIPIGIETTSELVSANLHEKESGDEAHDSENVRMLYAMALVRFVNFMADMGQNRFHELSIHAAAGKFIPSWIVEMRHCATHSALPALKMLRIGVAFALDWLRVNYWNSIRTDYGEKGVGRSRANSTESLTFELLNTFRILQYEHLYGQSKKGSTENHAHVKSIVNELRKFNERNQLELIKQLGGPGMLVMGSDEISKLAMFDATPKAIPEALLNFWSPVLKIVFELDKVNLLLANLLSNLEVEAKWNFESHLTYTWAVSIIKAILSSEDRARDSKLLIFSKKHPQCIDWVGLLKKLIRIPGPYVLDLIPDILNEAKSILGQPLCEQLKKLFAIYNGYVAVDDRRDQDPKTFTVSDFDFIKSEINRFDGTRANDDCGQYSGDGIEWKNYPIGVLPPILGSECDGSQDSDRKSDNSPSEDEDVVLSDGDVDDSCVDWSPLFTDVSGVVDSIAFY